MPRINIEEKWWSDPRRAMLIQLLGLGVADGAFLNAIRQSQLSNGQPFDTTGIMPPSWVQALLGCSLATGTPEALYVKGSSEHHAWLEERRAAGQRGGRISAEKRSRNEKGLFLSKLDPSKTKQIQPSSSSSNTNNNRNSVRLAPDPSPDFLEALGAINKELGTHYRPLDANRRLIEPRLAEGATIHDLVDVARLKKAQWADDVKMRSYLRIKTLYNQTNFENYLAEVKQAKDRVALYDQF